jgi:cobalt-zinc-cadmium efflux system protein
MLAVALLGLLANVAVLRVLGAGHGANLNLAAARLHVISDLLGSIAASVAAVVILASGWTPVDPLLSMLVALLIVRSAAGLLLESAREILRGTAQPAGGIGAGVDPPA